MKEIGKMITPIDLLIKLLNIIQRGNIHVYSLYFFLEILWVFPVHDLQCFWLLTIQNQAMSTCDLSSVFLYVCGVRQGQPVRDTFPCFI